MLLLGKSKITIKGQVTLPKSVREENGVTDSHAALFYKEDDGNIILKIQSLDVVEGYYWDEHVFNLLNDFLEYNPVVAVIGGSGTGKTTFSEEFIEHQNIESTVKVFDDNESELEFTRYLEDKEDKGKVIWVNRELTDEVINAMGSFFVVVTLERLQPDFYSSHKRQLTISRWKKIEGQGYCKTTLLKIESRK